MFLTSCRKYHCIKDGMNIDLGQGWGGKLSGNTIRIAIALTMYTDDRATISGKTMEGAVKLARWFQAHAMNLMGGDSELSPEANEALQWLTRNGEAEVTVAKARNQLRKRKTFQKGDMVDGAFLELETANYIRQCMPAHDGSFKKPTGPVIMLHPSLLHHEEEQEDGVQERDESGPQGGTIT